MSFAERTPLEQGFAQVFDDKIQPKLNTFETMRHAAKRKAYRNMVLILLGAIVCLAGIYFIWGPDPALRLSPLAVIFGGVGLWSVWGSEGDRHSASLEEAIMPVVCAHIGNLQYEPLGSNFGLEPLRALTLLPRYDSAQRKSRLSGTYEDTEYEMVHVTLTERHTDAEGRSRNSTVFKGLLFRISVPAKVPGRIVLMRDHGGIGNRLAEAFSFQGARAMDKVKFDNSDFEAAFEVYAEEPAKAKAFMPDAFLDALLKIGAEQGQGRGARAFVAGFEGGSFYMALKRSGSFMQIGSLTQSAMDIEPDLHGVFDDIAISHQIIDRLHGV